MSQLAPHTRNLLAHPRGALAITEPDTLEGDPQRLQRVTVTGTASVLQPTEPAYVAAAQAYIERFPDAQMRFELGDFLLFRFMPADARYVGGFARAARFSWAGDRGQRADVMTLCVAGLKPCPTTHGSERTTRTASHLSHVGQGFSDLHLALMPYCAAPGGRHPCLASFAAA